MAFFKKSLIILLCVSHVDMLEVLIGDLMVIPQSFKLTKSKVLFVSEKQLTNLQQLTKYLRLTLVFM